MIITNNYSWIEYHITHLGSKRWLSFKVLEVFVTMHICITMFVINCKQLKYKSYCVFLLVKYFDTRQLLNFGYEFSFWKIISKQQTKLQSFKNVLRDPDFDALGPYIFLIVNQWLKQIYFLTPHLSIDILNFVSMSKVKLSLNLMELKCNDSYVVFN